VLNQIPKIMKLASTFLALFSIVLTSCTPPPIEEGAFFESNEALLQSATMVEIELLELVNSHRENLGLSILENNAEAYESANEHNAYMIAQGKISHDRFDSRASNLANETGAILIKENVAKSYVTAEKALNGWLNSPSHKSTIEGDFTHTGVGVIADEEGKLYFTQLFFKK